MRMPKRSVGLIVWRFDRKVSDAYSRWRDRNRGTVRIGGQRLEHPTHDQTHAPNAWLPVHLDCGELAVGALGVEVVAKPGGEEYRAGGHEADRSGSVKRSYAGDACGFGQGGVAGGNRLLKSQRQFQVSGVVGAQVKP